MITKGLIGRLLGEEEISAKTAPEPFSQLRDPTLDERVSVYLRAVSGMRDFGQPEYSDARNRILNAMAADVAVKLGNDLPDISGMPVDPEYSGIPVDPEYEVTATETDVYPAAMAVSPGVYRAPGAHFSDISARLAAPPSGYPAAKADERHFATAAPEITPPRRPPFKFSLRTIGTLSIIVCAAAVIASAGTLLFFRNEDSSLAWFAQPQQSSKTEVAVQSSGSKAASLSPATVKPVAVTAESPDQQPSPEELADLVKRGRALLTAETASRAPATKVEVQAVASGSPTQHVSSEELAELVRSGSGLLGTGTASLLPSLAASQAVASASPTLAAAQAWYQNSKVFGSTESIGSASGNRNPSVPER
jgi:hypothetical protein